MKRVLLTGAGGFVGHHTLEHLLVSTDWEIVCLDSFRHRGKTDRIREVLDGLRDGDGVPRDVASQYDDRVTVLAHDLRVPISRQLDAEIGYVNYVISMASDSHVDRSCVEPRPFIENNVSLVLTLLEWMRDRNTVLRNYDPIQKFLHVSTDEVYGPAPVGHDHVEGEPHRPSNPYSASKACQEDIAFSYWRTFGLPVAVTNCWAMETRLLTDQGLLGYDELEIGDQVWTLDEDENMVLQPVLDKVRMRGPGRMIHFSGHAEQLVTPNHRMMVRESTGRPRRWGGIEETYAEHLVGMRGRVAIPRNGKWVGEDAAVQKLMDWHGREIEFDSDWLARAFGWYVSEGYLVTDSTVCFGAGTEAQMETIEELLADWGKPYRSGRSVRLTSRTLNSLFAFAGSGAAAKRVPALVKNLSSRYLESFLDAAIAGDGTRYGSGGVIYTISEVLAADYAEVAMKCGYAVRISERETRHPRKDKMIHSYIVRLSRRSDSYIEAGHVAEVDHGGDVWCVSVPSGRVFAEYRGAISLTGQTMNIIGERQDPEKFVPKVLAKVLKGETVAIHASPGNLQPGSRFYLHARNQADALLFLLETRPFYRYGDTAEDAECAAAKWLKRPLRYPAEMQRFNVVGEQEIDNLQMAQMIADCAGKTLDYDLVDFHSSRPGHDLRYSLDGSLMAGLGWKAPVRLEDSLKKTIDWTLKHPEWLLP